MVFLSGKEAENTVEKCFLRRFTLADINITHRHGLTSHQSDSHILLHISTVGRNVGYRSACNKNYTVGFNGRIKTKNFEWYSTTAGLLKARRYWLFSCVLIPLPGFPAIFYSSHLRPVIKKPAAENLFFLQIKKISGAGF